MTKVKISLAFILMVCCIGTVVAFKIKGGFFVYVHATNDPISDRCTAQLWFWTATNNGATRFISTASSISIKSGCRTIDIYPAQ